MSLDISYVVSMLILRPCMIVVVDEASKEGAVVDPYDWQKMLNFVKEKGVNVREAECRYYLKCSG